MLGSELSRGLRWRPLIPFRPPSSSQGFHDRFLRPNGSWSCRKHICTPPSCPVTGPGPAMTFLIAIAAPCQPSLTFVYPGLWNIQSHLGTRPEAQSPFFCSLGWRGEDPCSRSQTRWAQSSIYTHLSATALLHTQLRFYICLGSNSVCCTLLLFSELNLFWGWIFHFFFF